MPQSLSWLARFDVVSLLIASAMVVGGTIWTEQAIYDSNVLAVYDEVQKFGDDCAFATGEWRAGDTFDLIKNRPHVFSDLKMPFRAAEHKPVVSDNDYLVTRCRADFSSLDKTGYGWLNLGMIFGASALYVDGSLRAVTSEKKFLELPLLPTDRHAGVEILLISRRDPMGQVAGLGSLVPLAFGNSQQQAERLLQLTSRSFLEIPMTRTNYCLGLLVFFAAVWFAGIRYPDVGWMAVTLSSLVVVTANDYFTGFQGVKFYRDILVVSYIPLTFGVSTFSFAFFRIPLRHRWVQLAMVGTTALYAGLYFAFRDHNLINLGTSDRLFWGVSATALTVAAVMGWGKAKDLPPRRRWKARSLCIFNVVTAVLFCYMITVRETHPFFLGNEMTIIAASIFALFLALDLVVFQRQFFQERDLRRRSDGEVRRLQDTLTLGGAIQTLLLPKEGSKDFGPYRLECRYKPHGSLAGDWYSFWEIDDAVTLIFGDVTGKGPAAALAVSTIMTLLREAQKDGDQADRVVERLHLAIQEIFHGHLFSTATVVEARVDGSIRYANFGADGLMHFGCDKARQLVARGPLLGSQGPLRVRWHEGSLKSGEAVVGYTDGFVDGSQSQKNWLKRVNAANLNPADFEGLFALAEESRHEYAQEDDRTMTGLIYLPEADSQPVGRVV